MPCFHQIKKTKKKPRFLFLTFIKTLTKKKYFQTDLKRLNRFNKFFKKQTNFSRKIKKLYNLFKRFRISFMQF